MGQARGVAHQECLTKAGAGARCRHLLTFSEGCGAVVGAYKGTELTKWYGESDPSLAGAQAGALAVCRKARPQDTCRVVETVCASGGRS